MDFSLKGKVALITGGSRGIGKATALGFARAGADVVVASRKLDELEKVAEKIRGMGRESLAIEAHVGRVLGAIGSAALGVVEDEAVGDAVEATPLGVVAFGGVAGGGSVEVSVDVVAA